MTDIRTTEGREELRDGLIPAGALYYHHALLALDGLDIAEEMAEAVWIMREVARILGGGDDPQLMRWYYAAETRLWMTLRRWQRWLEGGSP